MQLNDAIYYFCLLQSKFGFSLSSCVLSVWLYCFTFPSKPFLSFHYYFLCFNYFFVFLSFEMFVFLLSVHFNFVVPYSLLHLFFHFFCFPGNLHDPEVSAGASFQDEIILLGSSTIGIIYNQASREATFHRCCRNHF